MPKNSKCELCGRCCSSGDYIVLCMPCEKEINGWISEYYECGICGRFIPCGDLCSQCEEESPPFILARSIGPYRGILKYAVHNLKFRGDRKLASPLGRMLGRKISLLKNAAQIDIIVPVPMYSSSLRRRGFNQALLLAREVGREISKPTLEDLLLKGRNTAPQTQLSFKERNKNLKGSFYINGEISIKGKNILLIDDIFTTGNTAAECSRELLKAGAEGVAVGTAASGVYHA